MDEPEPVPASNGDDEEKKEAGYESNSSPSVGSVAEANGVTEIDSSADNVRSLLLQFLKLGLQCVLPNACHSVRLRILAR